MLGRKKTTSKKKKKSQQDLFVVLDGKLRTPSQKTNCVMTEPSHSYDPGLGWDGERNTNTALRSCGTSFPEKTTGPTVRLTSLLHKALQDSTVPKLAFLISNTNGISQWTEVSQWLGSFKLFVVLFCFDTWFCYTAQASLELAAIFLLLTFHLEVGGF